MIINSLMANIRRGLSTTSCLLSPFSNPNSVASEKPLSSLIMTANFGLKTEIVGGIFHQFLGATKKMDRPRTKAQMAWVGVREFDQVMSFLPPLGGECEFRTSSITESYVTNFAPPKALTFIKRGKLALDQRGVLFRVNLIPTIIHHEDDSSQGHWRHSRKVDARLPGKKSSKGKSNSYGARPIHLTIKIMKWI